MCIRDSPRVGVSASCPVTSVGACGKVRFHCWRLCILSWRKGRSGECSIQCSDHVSWVEWLLDTVHVGYTQLTSVHYVPECSCQLRCEQVLWDLRLIVFLDVKKQIPRVWKTSTQYLNAPSHLFTLTDCDIWLKSDCSNKWLHSWQCLVLDIHEERVGSTQPRNTGTSRPARQDHNGRSCLKISAAWLQYLHYLPYSCSSCSTVV